MKKRLIILLLAGCMVLSGCGAKEDSEIQRKRIKIGCFDVYQ